jgi:phage terminase Nu1 subunit (DNA packaging protein)
VLAGRPSLNRGGVAKGPSGKCAEQRTHVDGDCEMTFVEAQRRKESALARLNEMKLVKEAGTVIDAAEAERLWAETCSDIRQRMLAVPARVAARAPHFGRSDIAIIESEIRSGLIELADEVK